MPSPVEIEGSHGVVLAAEVEDGLTYQIVRLSDAEVDRIARRIVELLGHREALRGQLATLEAAVDSLRFAAENAHQDLERFRAVALYWQKLAADAGLQGDAAWAVWDAAGSSGGQSEPRPVEEP